MEPSRQDGEPLARPEDCPLELFRRLDLVGIEDEALATIRGAGAVLLLNGTARRVVTLAQQGFDHEQIISALAESTGLPATKIAADLAGLQRLVRRALEESAASRQALPVAVPLDPQLRGATYLVFGRRLRIDYPDDAFAACLHPFLAPFLVAGEDAALRVTFEIEGPTCTVRCGRAAFAGPASGPGVLGALCQALLFHDIPERPELPVFLHCGGVLGKKGAWLIAGVSGRGKSTLVSALDAAGHTVLGDDILPVDPARRRVFPVPLGMSIKPGSWARVLLSHPSMAAVPTTLTATGKTVRVISPENPPGDVDRAGHPIAGLLFPDRSDGAGIAIEPVGLKEAMLVLCNVAGRFPGSHVDLSELADCVSSLPRYRLRYTDVDGLLPSLRDLL